MRIEIDPSEVWTGYDGDSLAGLLRQAIEDEMKKWVRNMVRTELDRIGPAIRNTLADRATAILQQALDKARDIPDEDIVAALLDGRADPRR